MNTAHRKAFVLTMVVVIIVGVDLFTWNQSIVSQQAAIINASLLRPTVLAGLLTDNLSSADRTFIGALPVSRTVKKFRGVKLSSQYIAALKDAKTSVTLFPETTLSLVKDAINQKDSTHFTWSGHIEGRAQDKVYMAVRGTAVAANFYTQEGVYQLRYKGNGIHTVSLIDAKKLSPDGHAHIEWSGPTSSNPSRIDDAPTSATRGELITLYAPYTAAARDAAGGVAGIESVIDLLVAETNEAFGNSGVNATLALVKTGVITYTEAGNAKTDWKKLTDSTDTTFRSVRQIRDKSKADLVSLIVANGGVWCGYASIPMRTYFGRLGDFEKYAEAVVDYNCTGSYTLAHELGHLMGANHDPANSDYDGTKVLLPYAFGYQDPNEAFRTIMAYSCPTKTCPVIPYYSNPTLTFNGAPMGVRDKNDNVQTLNATTYTVSRFR